MTAEYAGKTKARAYNDITAVSLILMSTAWNRIRTGILDLDVSRINENEQLRMHALSKFHLLINTLEVEGLYTTFSIRSD